MFYLRRGSKPLHDALRRNATDATIIFSFKNEIVTLQRTLHRGSFIVISVVQ